MEPGVAEAERAGSMVSISQDALRRSIGPARHFEVERPPEEVKIAASFWDRKTGAVQQHYEPNSTQRRKHQINHLAHQAQQNAETLKNRSSQGLLSKAQVKAKYGW